jgi:hypothetical protein
MGGSPGSNIRKIPLLKGLLSQVYSRSKRMAKGIKARLRAFRLVGRSVARLTKGALMSSRDIAIFQVLAGAFTFSFICLIVGLLAYLYRLDKARSKVVELLVKRGKNGDPVLVDLRAGSMQVRVESGVCPPQGRLAMENTQE